MNVRTGAVNANMHTIEPASAPTVSKSVPNDDTATKVPSGDDLIPLAARATAVPSLPAAASTVPRHISRKSKTQINRNVFDCDSENIVVSEPKPDSEADTDPSKLTDGESVHQKVIE